MLIHRPLIWISFAFMCVTYLCLGQSPWKAPQTAQSGLIHLEILTSACAALSPQINPRAIFSSQRLNDWQLDPFELIALQEGCSLRAVAIAPNGMRLTDIPLVLFRQDAASGEVEVFGSPRSTDDYGSASWSFSLTPHTDFTYYVESPSPTKRTVRSNPIEIALCTGEESVNLVPGAPREDIGRGCSR